MSFKLFCAEVRRICDKYGLRIWELKHEDGKHIARLSCGYNITANSTTGVVEFWNRNHSIPTTWEHLLKVL